MVYARAQHDFGNVRILVVEDTMIVADEIVRILRGWKCEVVGPAGRVSEALNFARAEHLDAALLDVNLHGEWSHPVADELMERGVPLLIMSGYGRESLPDRLRDVPRLTKPFGATELHEAIDGLLASSGRLARG